MTNKGLLFANQKGGCGSTAEVLSSGVCETKYLGI